MATQVGIRIVQLHGHEPEEDLVALESFQIVRAFRLDRASGWSRVIDIIARARCSRPVAGRGSDRRLCTRPAWGHRIVSLRTRLSTRFPPCPD